MKVEIECPFCNKRFQVIIPVYDIDEKNYSKDDQTILEHELFEKHNIILG